MARINKGKSQQIDMLHSGLADKILLFALPLAVSSILQQLFNAVDIAVVGHFASSQAQAAVGCNGPVINLLLNLFIGISVGANVVIANYIGSQKKDKISGAVHTAMLIAIISGLILLVLGIAVSRPMLQLMDTPPDVLEGAVVYLRIYFLGMPFIMAYNFGAAILRSIGDTKRPMYCLVFSGMVNAGLNLLLVIQFKMGVAGVSIATVVSNIINAVLILFFLSREEEPVRLSIRQLRIQKEELAKMLRIGMPAGLQGMVFAVANAFIQTAVNGFGSNAAAGSTVTLNYEYVNYFIISAFNQAAVTFTSQNYGAGEYGRCKKIFRLCMAFSLAFSAMVSIVVLIGQDFFISLFTTDKAVIEYAAIKIQRMFTLNCMVSTYEISGAALRGMGYSMTPAMLTVFGTCVFRLAWIALVCQKYHTFGVLVSVYPISWVVTGAAVLAAYFILRKKAFAGKSIGYPA